MSAVCHLSVIILIGKSAECRWLIPGIGEVNQIRRIFANGAAIVHRNVFSIKPGSQNKALGCFDNRHRSLL